MKADNYTRGTAATQQAIFIPARTNQRRPLHLVFKSKECDRSLTATAAICSTVRKNSSSPGPHELLQQRGK